MLRSIQRYAQVALLIAGSAILLYSCDKESVAEEPNDEALMTEYSEHLTMTNTENGRKSYVFTAPLVEGYSLAKEPYQEFRKGVDIVTYQKDSTGAVDATLTANYAIHYGNRKLWEAKGNVVVKKSNGQESGNSYIVEGFESDDQLKDWKFRRIKGRMWVNIEPTRDADSTSVKPVADNVSAATEAVSEQPVKPARPIRGNDRKIQLTPVESNDRSL